MKWIITFLKGARHPEDCPRFSIGSRIKTPKGEGTVIGGSINVRLDFPWYAKNRTPQSCQSFNLDKLN